MSKELNIEKLMKAGEHYQSVMEELRTHHHAYRKMIIDIAVKENHAMNSSKRAIKLPPMPTLEDHEISVADQLIDLATELARRPCRLNPTVNLDELACVIPITSKMTPFSPLALARELSEKMLGAGASQRVRAKAAQELKAMLKHPEAGLVLSLNSVATTPNDRGRLLDEKTSEALYQWLICFCEALEKSTMSYLLGRIEELIEEIENIGHATIGSNHIIRDEDMSLRISLRKNTLRVFLSSPLSQMLREFIDCEESNLVETKGSHPVWFRSEAKGIV